MSKAIEKRITELETSLTEMNTTLNNIRNQEQIQVQNIIATQGAVQELKKLVGDKGDK